MCAAINHFLFTNTLTSVKSASTYLLSPSTLKFGFANLMSSQERNDLESLKRCVASAAPRSQTSCDLILLSGRVTAFRLSTTPVSSWHLRAHATLSERASSVNWWALSLGTRWPTYSSDSLMDHHSRYFKYHPSRIFVEITIEEESNMSCTIRPAHST